jgi:hypothetical protein
MANGKLEEILTANQPAEIALIKSILEGERIHYVAQGENHSSLEGILPVRFLVASAEADRARGALRDFL